MNHHLKHSRNELPHLEEGLGRGFYPQLFLYRRKPDFLNGQRPLFFTVAADGVMHRMTVGMAASTRRKTHFPTVGTDITAKAKPPSAATAFCIYSITLIGAIKVEKHMIDPIQSAATKSRRSPARRREKWKGKYHRLAPPSHYIHPQANHPQPYSTLPHRHLHQAESPPTSR